MSENGSKAGQDQINNFFSPMNNLFEYFEEITSELVIQITDFVNPFFENMIKV